MIYNFCGEMFKRLGDTHGASRYERAEKSFGEASKACPEWYLPHENLADSLSMRGALQGDASLQVEALADYEQALKRVKATTTIHPDVDRTDAQKEKITLELKVAKAVAARLTGDPDLIREHDPGLLSELRAERDDEVLYTWACWFATKWRLGPNEATDRLRAGEYLVAAIFCKAQDYGDWVLDDPDLKVFPKVDIAAAVAGARARAAEGDIPKLPADRFVAAVTDVLVKARWPGAVAPDPPPAQVGPVRA